MGLRFRKSITLCKGVRLNIGKTGVSISAGVPGFRKTIHSSGRVTTSVGIPGTGIYYVDTQNPTKDTGFSSKKPEYRTPTDPCIPSPQSPSKSKINSWEQPICEQPSADSANTFVHQGGPRNNSTIFDTSSTTEYPSSSPEQGDFSEGQSTEMQPLNSETFESEYTSNVGHSGSVATSLFEHCDYSVKWIDVLTDAEPPEDGYNSETWKYLRSKAVAIFNGDVDAMFEVIEHVNPYDDLLEFLSDFQFEADDSEHLVITCTVIQVSLGEDKATDAASVIIRLARDTFALLPISTVRIHAHNVPNGVMDDVCFERKAFNCATFTNKNPVELMAGLCVGKT